MEFNFTAERRMKAKDVEQDLGVRGRRPVYTVVNRPKTRSGLSGWEEFELPLFFDGGKLKAQRAQLAAVLMLPAHDA